MSDKFDLGFVETVELSTNDLPYLSCDPPLRFEFNLRTSFEFHTKLHQWSVYQDLAEGGATHFNNEQFKDLSIEIANNKANTLLMELASILLQRVIRLDGVEYKLGSIEAIESLIESTTIQFVIDLMKSWLLHLAIERDANKKKQTIFSDLSTSNNGKLSQT